VRHVVIFGVCPGVRRIIERYLHIASTSPLHVHEMKMPSEKKTRPNDDTIEATPFLPLHCSHNTIEYCTALYSTLPPPYLGRQVFVPDGEEQQN
jgi:hypothetical protein